MVFCTPWCFDIAKRGMPWHVFAHIDALSILPSLYLSACLLHANTRASRTRTCVRNNNNVSIKLALAPPAERNRIRLSICCRFGKWKQCAFNLMKSQNEQAIDRLHWKSIRDVVYIQGIPGAGTVQSCKLWKSLATTTVFNTQIHYTDILIGLTNYFADTIHERWYWKWMPNEFEIYFEKKTFIELMRRRAATPALVVRDLNA